MAGEPGDLDQPAGELPDQPWVAPAAAEPFAVNATEPFAGDANRALPFDNGERTMIVSTLEPPAPMPARPKRRRRLWLRLTILLVILGVAGGGGWVVLRDQGRDSAASAPGQSTAPAKPLHPNQIATSRAAISELFDRRSEAVGDKSLKAFLADLDPANKKLIARQKTLFKNLGKLPVTRYEQVVSGYVTPTPAQPGNFDGAWKPGYANIEVRVQLDQVDRRPTIARYRAKLELREGQLVITGMSSDSVSRPYAPTPWEAAELTVVQTKHMLVAITPDAKNRAREVADAAERAYATSLRLWPKQHAFEFVIFGTTKRSTYENWYGLDDDKLNTSVGKTVPIPTCCGTKYKMLGDTSSTHIILDLSKMEERIDLEWVIAHELTHAVAQPLSSNNSDVPNWADEGYAEYVGISLLDARGYYAYWARDVREYVRKGKFTGKLPADATFYGKNSHINYALSVRFFEYLVREYGKSKVENFYFYLNGMYRPDVDAAMRKYFGTSEQEIVKDWAAWIRNS